MNTGLHIARSRTPLSIPIEDDEIDEPDDTIIVTILDPTNSSEYLIGASSSAQANVIDDDDPPIISIADAPEVVEGSDSNAEFTIVASQLPAGPLAINFEVSGDTSFIPTGQVFTSEFSFSSNSATGEYTAALNIPIEDDQIDETDGIIVVTLLPDNTTPTTYTIDSNPANQSAQVSVTDDDLPIPEFSISAVISSVEEPNSAQFRLTTSTATTQPVVVKYNVYRAGGYLDTASNDYTITVEANSVEKIFDVGIVQDSLSEPDTTVTVTLLADDNTPATYSITSDTTGQSADVTIIDDEPLPEISIRKDNTGTLEPGLAMFFLMTKTKSTIPITVRINVVQNGDVLRGSAGETTWTLPAMKSEYKFEIATANDEIAEPTGLVSAILLVDDQTPATYTLTSRYSRQSADVEVYDDDIQISITDAAAVVEGSDEFATFTITAPYPIRPERTVNIAVSGATNFIQQTSIPTSITFATFSSSEVLQIPIEDDDVDEADGFIYVEILPPTLTADGKTEYKVGATNNRAKVHVSDDDEATLPVISISTQTESIEEGENIELVVTSSQTGIYPLVVNVNLNQTNSIDSVDTNFIVGGLTRQVYFANGSALEKLSILTQDDKVDEPNGTISVSIAPNNNYELGQNSSLSVAVADNDVPMASIRTAAPNLSVPEGDLINFGVFLDRVTWRPIAVNVNVSQSSDGGNFINQDDMGATTITVKIGDRRQIFPVRTIDDEVDEADAEITATIMSGEHYAVPSPTTLPNSVGSYTVTARVMDNDDPPAIPDTSPVVLSIKPNKAQVNEGESVAFEVRADKTSEQPLPLNLRIDSTSEDFLNHLKTRYTGYLSALRYDARPHGVIVFAFSTVEDYVVGEDFEVVATLLDGDGYVANTEKNEATVVVVDSGESRPVVSISRVEDAIQEGEEASFLVRIDRKLNRNLDVKVVISSDVTGILIATQSLENIVKIDAGETSKLLTILTQGNVVDGPDSKISATLQADAQYLLPANQSNHADTITVLDDDVPSVAIFAENDSIVEGRIARFGVTTEVGVFEALSVSVVVNQTGDVITGGSGIETVHFEVGRSSRVIEVQTTDDQIDEIEGRITATIIDPNDGKYQTSGDGSDSVVVTDNDDPMISITSVVDRAITEGDVVQFTLTAEDREIDTELRINTSITQTSDFMTWRIPRSTIFPAGKKITTIVISTIDDNKEQEDGEFRAEILAGEGYQVSSQNTATVAIEDNDTTGDPTTGSDDQRISIADKIMQELLITTGVNLEPEDAKPVISIEVRNKEVAEGEKVRIAIQSSLVLDTDLVVEITIDSPNDSISESTPMRITIQAGSDTHLFELATKDDNKLEDEEKISLTINEQPTYTISDEAGSASVTLTDHKDWQQHSEIARTNGVVIPELAGRLSAQSLNQITERIQHGFTSDRQNVLQIAGSEELTGILEQSGDAVNNDTLLKDTLFNNSSFAFSLLPDSTGFGSATTWGSGNQLEFQSQGLGNSAMSGEMLSSHLGLDVAFNEELISGFTGTYSDTQIDYTALDSSYEYDVQMTGFFPYIGWQNTDRADYLRVVTGLGSGEIGIRQEGNNWDKLTSSLYTTEISGGLQVYADNDASDHAVSALSLDSGIRTLRYFTEQESDVIGHFDYRQSQSHLTLEGHYAKDLSNGIALIPTAAIGLQGLSGNVANEFGYILESGVSVENPVGWTLSGLGRTFFNSDDWSNDSQLQSTLAFDSNNDDLGTTVDITSSWGVAPTHENDSMWERHIFTRNSSTQTENSQTQISTEIGYGFGILDGSGILTPYNKIDWSDTNQQTIEFGSRVAVGAGISFELKGSRENRTNDEIDHQINFSGSFGW